MKLTSNKLYKLSEKYGTDKSSHGYVHYYDELFGNKKNKEINLLELGIFKGASIKMWDKYFKKGNIYCIDHLGTENPLTNNTIFSEEVINNLKKESHKIYPYLCEQNDSVKLNEIFQDINFDFIIDDASHFQKESIQSLGILFQKLNHNGVYVIEDMCTLWDFQTGSNWGQKYKLSEEDIDFENLPSKELFSDTLHYCFEKFNEEKIFFSEYLSNFENNYLSENIKSIDIIYAPRTKKQNIENGYHTIRNEGSKNSKLSAGSLAVITKK